MFSFESCSCGLTDHDNFSGSYSGLYKCDGRGLKQMGEDRWESIDVREERLDVGFEGEGIRDGS